jgi:16S rRNA (guanine1207-N2)-methyltransferase
VQYFDREPVASSVRREVELVLPDLRETLVTDRAVFSGDRIDTGTRYLLQEAPGPPAAGDLLDLGCGYGPITVALARRSPGATVWALDINERALALCRENVAALGLTNVRVVTPGEVSGKQRFAAIYSNPPIRIGKEPLHTLLDTRLRQLEPAGRCYLVVQKHLGSDSLQRWLTDAGWPTRRLGSRAGYRLLEVVPERAGGSHGQADP